MLLISISFFGQLDQYSFLSIFLRGDAYAIGLFLFPVFTNTYRKGELFMSNEVYQIYDKIFKKILTLSSMSVINLINGLFHTKYPSDSTITYNWTEFESEELKRILADTILTINGKYSYHMEAQMTEDEDIIFRVFEYGYGHADRNRRYAIDLITDEEGHIDSGTIESGCELLFPEPKIIYFCPSGKAPDEYILKLNFGSQGSFLYKVSTFKFLEISLEELNQ